MPGPTVAMLELEATSSDGSQFAILVNIGTPYRSETGEWACPIAMDGLYEDLEDVRGEDSFQALSLAIRFTLTLLADFQERGGRLRIDGDNFPIEDYGLLPFQSDD